MFLEIFFKATYLDIKFQKESNMTQKTVLSVAIVPVGLTKFRPKEDGLVAINQEYAIQVIDQVETIQRDMQKKGATTLMNKESE